MDTPGLAMAAETLNRYDVWNDNLDSEVDNFMKELAAEAPELLLPTLEFESFGFQQGIGVNSDPASPTALSPTTSELSPPLQRSSSKRSRNDLTSSCDDDTEKKGKRNKKVKDGFHCHQNGCDKSFDRACDLSKHQKRVHTAKDDRPYKCPECEYRACWPKDVKRHCSQVHAIPDEKPTIPSPTGLSLVIKQEPAFLHEPKVVASPMEVDVVPVSPSSPKSPTMAWLTRSLVMLKKLRLRSKSVDESEADDRYIFVTLDKKDFRLVDTSGANTADALKQKIAATYADQTPSQFNNFLLHRFRKGSKLGEQLSGDSLIAAVMKAMRAKRTLKLFLTPNAS